MTQSNLPPDRHEEWRPVPPMRGKTFNGYQVSDKGRFRSLDRPAADGRQIKGQMLAPPPSARDGYVLVGLTADDGERLKLSAHRIVLFAFAPRPKKGEETCHGTYGPSVNWYPENIRWGTKAENAADKPVNGGGPPSFPCRNAPTCGNMVMNEGRRCRDCVARVGGIAADMLNAGFGLEVVADRLGYENYDWVWKLARDFGGYTGTKRDALRQRPSLSQRVKLTLRHRRSDGWGDAA